ncbi:lipoprotein LpqH [Mycobacterium sp. WMMD1722]|uniref:lipoprotein LpqH n=1 Tax=Mycobacterium sp. WMMD1722 TaxID=3404117 RepID=UPI003BF56FFB
MSKRPCGRGSLVRTFGVIAVAILAITGCGRDFRALGTHTAQVSINGRDIGEQPRVSCDQIQWVWHIRTVQDSPGFTAQIRTGDSIEPRAVQIEGLGGFTGSFWDVTVGSAEAAVDDGTFIVTGVAEGYYEQSPTDRSTANFEIRTDC